MARKKKSTHVLCPICQGEKSPNKTRCERCKKLPLKIELPCETYRFPRVGSGKGPNDALRGK